MSPRTFSLTGPRRLIGQHAGRPHRIFTAAFYRRRVSIPDFDPDAGPPGYTYMKVADHLAARIAAAELTPGMRLPTERELARFYGVSLGTARRVAQELRERSLVITLPVKGTFVLPPS